MSDLESKFSFFIAVGISEVSVETVRYSYKQCKYVGMRLLLLVITVCVCARVHVCVCVRVSFITMNCKDDTYNSVLGFALMCEIERHL